MEESRCFRIVPQGLPNLAHGRIDGVVRVQEHILAPDSLQDFLPRHQLPTSLDQKAKELEGDAFEAYTLPRAAQLKGALVKLEVLESPYAAGHFVPILLVRLYLQSTAET